MNAFKIFAGVFLVLNLVFPVTAFSENYAVIVNSGNTWSADVDELFPELRNLFLTHKKSWPNGVKAKPVYPKPGSALKKAFLNKILGMDESRLARHWLHTKQVTGTSPPPDIASRRLTIQMVARNPGAFAVIVNKGERPDTVRVLLTF